MPTFKKKPRQVEAVLFDGTNASEIAQLTGKNVSEPSPSSKSIHISGKMQRLVMPGFWVVMDPEEGIVILSESHFKDKYERLDGLQIGF